MRTAHRKLVSGVRGYEMGQDDLVRLLKTKKKWLGAMEISKELKIGIRSTRLKLEKLRNKKEIKFKKNGRCFYYKYKNE